MRFTIAVKGIPLTPQSEPVDSVGTPKVRLQPEEAKILLRPFSDGGLSCSRRANE
jgi:hypothetical protein